MGFVIKNNFTQGKVEIKEHDNPNLIGKVGFIRKVSLSNQMVYVKLEDGNEVQVPMKNLLKIS